MKHNLPKLGMLLGIVIIICSVIRWFFMWYDPSQMILGVAIGIIVCCFAYVYDWMKERDIEQQKINKRLDAFTEWWTKQDME